MKKVVHVVVMVGLATGVARPAAAQVCQAAVGAGAGVVAPAAFGDARKNDTGAVTFTLAASLGESTLVAQAPTVTFEKKLTKNSVSIRVRSGNDVLSVDVDRAGVTRVGRRGKTQALKPTERPGDRLRRVQEVLAGSTALLAFEGLAAYLESSDRPEAVSVLTSYALVQALRGSSTPAQALAHRLNSRAKTGLTRIADRTHSEENILVCWAEYSYALVAFANQYETCFNDWWWNPIGQAACAFQFVLQAELAIFNVIACAGGMPV